MEAKTLLNIFLIIIILSGIFFIYKSIKGWDKSIIPTKASARLLKSILGYEGLRILMGIVGFIFIIFSIILFSIFYFNASLGFTKKDEVVMKTKSGEIYGTNAQIKDRLKYSISPEKKVEIEEISFKNNNIKDIPEYLWELKGLKSINFENNNLSVLPIEKIKSLDSLKILNIKNNPIKLDNVSEIQKLNIIVVK
jgi:hypothetical protein